MQPDEEGPALAWPFSVEADVTWRVWAGFALLCVLAGSGWALDEAAPGLLHGLLRIAMHDGVLAVAFGWIGLREGWRGPWLKLALGATLMFALPEVLFAAAAGHVSGLSEVLVYLLVPAAVIFVAAQRAAGFGRERNPLAQLAPALTALAGAALALPFAWPPTIAGQLWLSAMVVSAVAAGWAAVWMHELLAEMNVLRAAAVIFAASSVVAAAFCWVAWGGVPVWDGHAAAAEALRLVLVEGPILLLTVWLLREMKPVVFSARFFVIPLVAVVESYAVLRPTVLWTTWVGLGLLAGGTWELMRTEVNNPMVGDETAEHGAP